MSHAIIGMFDNSAAADRARASLIAGGIPERSVSLSSTTTSTSSATATAGPTGGTYKGEPKDFWYSIKEMFGQEDKYDSDDNLGYYQEGARRGAVVVRVMAEENQVDQVVNLLQNAGAVDVDAMAKQWRGSGWTGSTVKPPTATSAARPAMGEPISASSGTSTAAVTADRGRVRRQGSLRIIQLD